MTDTPDFVKSLLHRVGMSVTAPTTRTALESMSNTAAKNAKAMMKDDGRVKVLLFDNINIYMRRAQTRLMD